MYDAHLNYDIQIAGKALYPCMMHTLTFSQNSIQFDQRYLCNINYYIIKDNSDHYLLRSTSLAGANIGKRYAGIERL